MCENNNNEKTTEMNIICDFCGKNLPKNVIVAQSSSGKFICQNCIKQLNENVNGATSYIEKAEKTLDKKQHTRITPAKLKAHLDQYIEGQEYAKRVLSVAVYNHYKMLDCKLHNKAIDKEVELRKSNILLAGPSGCGKTEIVRTLAKKLKVPFVTADITAFSASGYVGRDVETIIRDLLDAANGDIKAAECGIVYIDEIDKTSRKGENLSTTADPGHEGVQQALLKLLEGAVLQVPDKGRRQHPEGNATPVNTENILFILGGAFEGIEKIISKRMRQGKNSIGIGATITDKKNQKYNDFIEKLTTEDLKKFGMLPELLGRVPVIAPMKELDEEQLMHILYKPKNALCKQYHELFAQDGVELEFKENAYRAIAKEAIRRKTGARGLRGIMEDILNPIMFDLPDCNEDYVVVDTDENNKIKIEYKMLKKMGA